MDRIKIERKDVFEIEVNDKGETITFNLGDVELPIKLSQAYDEIQNCQKELKNALMVINQHPDQKIKGKAMSKNDWDSVCAWKKFFTRTRAAMDKFLGPGGCQKIFGDSNYLEMYDDLYEEFSKPREDGKSIFDKMQISNESVYSRVREKYKKYVENNPEVL